MPYIKQDEFVEICLENNCSPKDVLDAIKQNNPQYGTNITQVSTRIANYKRKGLLPLSSGNKVDTGQLLKGTSTLFGANGEIKQQWVKTDVVKVEALDAFKNAVTNILEGKVFKPTPFEIPTVVNNDLMTIYPIGDAHIGMLAHEAETGEDHDLHISKARHLTAIKLAVEQAPNSETAFIVDTGDWFHSDNSTNRTTKNNNPLDVDGRYHKVIETGFNIAIAMIEAALVKHKNVHWRSAIGNHNEHSAIMLSYFLKAYFKDESRVIVHCSPSMYFYYQFGKNLIGITHGHTTKPTNLAGIMATDEPKSWGSTEYRYW